MLNRMNAAIWILSLVTTPGRAVTTIGDLTEDSIAHGKWWFWRQVVGTFSAHLARDFASAPIRLLLCAPFGPIMCLLSSSLVAQVLAPIVPVWFRTYYYLFPMEGRVLPQPPGMDAVFLCSYAVGFIVVGRGLARFSDRPIAAAVVFFISWAVLWSVMVVNGVRTTHFFPHYGIPQTLVLLGTIWERRSSFEPV